MNGKLNGKKSAQVSLELSLTLAALCLFIISTVIIFVWFNDTLAKRQEDYDRTRTAAGSTPEDGGYYEVQVDEYYYPQLDILNETQ